MGVSSGTHEVLPEAPLDIDTALVWSGRSDLALPVAPRPVHASLHGARLKAVRFYLRLGAGRDELRAMLEDGRLGQTERLLESTRAPFSRLEKTLKRIQRAEFHHLYVVEIVGVGTKVGISKTPSRRLSVHEQTARLWGRSLGRYWVSISHIEAERNERALIRSERHGAEVLTKSFDDVMALIERMPMTSLGDLFAPQADAQAVSQ